MGPLEECFLQPVVEGEAREPEHEKDPPQYGWHEDTGEYLGECESSH